MTPIIIGITGESGSGKDTVSEHMTENYDFVFCRIASPVKQLAALEFDLAVDRMDDWDYKESFIGDTGKTVRFALQEIATCFRRVDPYHWVKNAFDLIDANTFPRIVIPDVRFPEEAEMIRERKGVIFKTVKIGGVVSSTADHETEQGIALIEPDFTLQAAAGDIGGLLTQADNALGLVDGPS